MRTETGAEVLRAPFNISGHVDTGGHVPALDEHGADLPGGWPGDR